MHVWQATNDHNLDLSYSSGKNKEVVPSPSHYFCRLADSVKLSFNQCPDNYLYIFFVIGIAAAVLFIVRQHWRYRH